MKSSEMLSYSDDKIRERFIQIWLEKGKKKGMKQAEFARKLEITPNQLKEILKKRQYVSLKIVKQLQLKFDVPANWIIYEKGKSESFL